MRLTDELFYEVPLDKHAQLLYFRAGNSTDEMIYVILTQNGRPKRYCPIGARADSHVTLAIEVFEDVGLFYLVNPKSQLCQFFQFTPPASIQSHGANHSCNRQP